MASTLGEVSRRRGGFAHPKAHRLVAAVAPPLGVLVLLGLLLPVGLGSVFGAAFALFVILFLTVLVTVGIEGTAIGMFVLGFLLSPMNDVRPVEALTFITASDVFLVLGVVLLVPYLLTRGFEAQLPFMVGAAGVVAFGLLSSAASADPATSLNAVLRLVVGALVFPVAFMLWRPRREVVIALAAAYLFGNCISVGHALVFGAASYEGRYLGLTRHPNILGLCSMLSLAVIPFLWQELPRWSRFYLLVGAAFGAYGVWISGSRAALLVTVAVLAVYLVLSRSIGFAVILFGLSILPIYFVGRTLASGDAGNNILGRLQGNGSATFSDLQREQLIREATDKFVTHPILGVGFGDVLEAHNIYLQVAAAGGIMGLLFYLILLGAVAWQPFRLGTRYLPLALPVLAYAMIGAITPLLWDRYIWCLLALPFLVSLSDRSATPTTPSDRSDQLQETS